MELKQQVREVYDSFDKNLNGTIKRSDVTQLAFECGVKYKHLTPQKMAPVLDSLDPTAMGIPFETFYQWFASIETSDVTPGGGGVVASAAADDQVEEQDAILAAMQKSEFTVRAIVRTFLAAKRLVERDCNQPAKFCIPALDCTAGMQLSLGDFSDPGASIELSYKLDAASVAAARQEANCPEACNMITVDFSLAEGFSEDALGQISGQIDVALGGVQALQETMPAEQRILHSHNIDLVANAQGKTVLRLFVFVNLGQDMAKLMVASLKSKGNRLFQKIDDDELKADFAPLLPRFGKASLRIETFLSLMDLADPKLDKSVDNSLRFRLAASLVAPDFDSTKWVDQLRCTIGAMNPTLASISEKVLAKITSLPPKLSVNFRGLNELKDTLVMAAQIAPPKMPEKYKQFYETASSLATKLQNLPPFGNPDDALQSMEFIPRIKRDAERLSLEPVLDSIAENITGLDSIVFFLGEVEVRLSCTGLDVVPFLLPKKGTERRQRFEQRVDEFRSTLPASELLGGEVEVEASQSYAQAASQS
jgi:hypothetical protein